MAQWQNRQQRTRHLAWVISLLLFLSPILALAHGNTPAAGSGDASAEMPCHQAESTPQNKACKHCSGTEISLTCDCCDCPLPINLFREKGEFFTFQLQAEPLILPVQQQFPDPPPGSLYRPPIQHLI